MRMRYFDRRRMLGLLGAGAVGLVAGGAPGMTAEPLSRESIEHTLAQLARQWETTAPLDVIHQLTPIVRDAARAGNSVHARLLTMYAQALSDARRPGAASMTASMARTIAVEAGDDVTRSHAAVIGAEIAIIDFKDHDSATMLASAARGLVARTGVAAIAATVEALARAERGETGSAVLEPLREAERVQPEDGVVGFLTGRSAWHPGYLGAAGARALIRAGEFSEAMARLGDAPTAFDRVGAHGAMSMTRMYQARAAMGMGRIDDAFQCTTEALAVSAGRPAKWLVDGSLELATAAERRGAHWGAIRDYTVGI